MPKTIRTNTKRDKGDPTFDLIKVFEGHSIGEMDDEELKKRIEQLHIMRRIRVTKRSGETALSIMLRKITPENARIFLETLEKGEKKENDGDRK